MDEVSIGTTKREALISVLEATYQPTIECIESRGECDYRSDIDDTECPCKMLVDLRAARDNDVEPDK